MCRTKLLTVDEMTEHELIVLRNRLYAHIRTNDNPRLDLQLHAVQGELKDRGYVTKKRAISEGIEPTGAISEPSEVEDDYSDVVRLEIIDHTKCEGCHGTGRITIESVDGDFECPACHGLGAGGREVVFYDDKKKIEAQLQDEGRTLKIFVNKRKP